MQPIFQAILHNDLQTFLGLVAERESSLEEINEEDGLNNTVLHKALMLGHRELVSNIIELRPSLVISRNAFGNTPLHLAALHGDVNIVMQMLETGSEVCSARNNDRLRIPIAVMRRKQRSKGRRARQAWKKEFKSKEESG